MNLRSFYICLISGAALALSGCGGSSGGTASPRATVDTSYAAIAQTALYGATGAGDIEIIELDDDGWEAISGFAPTTTTDHDVMAYGEHFYQIGRLGIDSLAKRDIANPVLVEWEYSTKEQGSSSANPYQLVFKSASEAFLIRFGSSISWLVNLDAATQSDFLLAELDLSAYDEGDGSPEAAAGVIVGDYLYVIVKRLDSSWAPQEAYVAVIDISTNEEIDLGIDPALKGIPLQTRNPNEIVHVEGLGLVIQSTGRYYPQEFTGGIEVVDLSDYSTSVVVDDGGDYDQITDMAIVDQNTGYLATYHSYQDGDIYRFNPSTGEVEDAPLSGMAGIDVGVLETDPEGRVWVGVRDSVNPRFVVIDSEDDSVIDVVPTTLGPIGLAFTAE